MFENQTPERIRDVTVDTRGLRREATRTRILEAAWRLARRDGLAAVSLRQLAAEVGMRAPSLYTYFESKNELYDAMYAQGLYELRGALGAAPAGRDALSTLTQQVKLFARFCTADPCRYQLIFERPVPGFVPSPESFAIGVEGLARIAKLAEAAGIKGQRSFDLFRAVTTGLVSLQVANEPGGDRWTRLVDEAVEMLVSQGGRHGRKGRKRASSK